MENLGTKTVDDLGRIIIPRKVREAKGWNMGNKLTFYNYNGVIVIETCGQTHEPGHLTEQAQDGP